MFKVIRIPTKFSRTIKRFSDKDKAKLLDSLISIWDWESIQIPDNVLWDTISLIYWEWMNMEAKNWIKIETPLILPSMSASMSEARVEYSIVEENILEENKIDITSVTAIAEYWKKEINDMQELIKQECILLWIVYKAWKYERQRIENILTAIEYWELCDRMNMTRIEFALNIMRFSTKLSFWNWKIYNAETIYKNYAIIYNEWKRQKEELQKKDYSIFTI